VSADRSRSRPDAGEATGEVQPADIVTSRAPLETRDPKPKLSAPPAPKAPQRGLSVSEWPEWVFYVGLAAIFLAFGTAILMDKYGR